MTSSPPLASKNVALFLDFDGTLVEIADHPDAVRLGDATKQALITLSERLGGALAIVTGREIEAIDGFLSPLRLPVAGVHGLARRDAEGRLSPAPDMTTFIEHARTELAPLLAAHNGLLMESKAASVALHYRACPELESLCIAAMEAMIDNVQGIELKRGKMVLEAKPTGADKGTAVIDFLSEAPFAGRQPVFAGDDVTDEDAFRAVNALGGISIKVGDGQTVADYTTADTAEFLVWLETSARQLSGEIKA